ncbi:hypothetical protein EG68_09274 [Paragonimus skrjabini miyazakii]|uniref:Uncharacterized protein n=1 Tax=Paragonimus skrjabini miyazakii TaxID=59628 RepID=A0A8S9YRA7_9TREM|nr:hypothetical protein EG68_09274 [Paragonimus skrjabini miyazakii]
MFAGNSSRKKHIQAQQANPTTDSRSYWKTRRNFHLGKANRNVPTESGDLIKPTDRKSHGFSNSSTFTCYTKYKWQASDTPACNSAKPIEPSKNQTPVLNETNCSYGSTSHIRKLVRSNSVPSSVTHFCRRNLSQVRMKFREHNVRVRNRPQSTPKTSNLVTNAESAGKNWTSVSRPSSSAVTRPVRECAGRVYGGEGTSNASKTVGFSETPRSGNHEMPTYRSQSYPSNLSFQLSNRTVSNASWWSKRNKESRPPWFPAGRGGSAISHHRQFQVFSDRLRITSLLRKVASRTLFNSPHILKRSPQRTFTEVGLENLPAAVSSARIRDINSVLPHVCWNHPEKTDTDGEPAKKTTTQGHASFPYQSMRSLLASSQGPHLSTIGQRYPPIGPRFSRKGSGESSVGKPWLTSPHQDPASDIQSKFEIPQAIRVSNANMFLYNKFAVHHTPRSSSTTFLKKESDYMKTEVLNQVSEGNNGRKNAQSAGDPGDHVSHKRICSDASSTLICNKILNAGESGLNGCASPDPHSVNYHTASAHSLTSSDLDVIASSCALVEDKGYLETPQLHMFTPANDSFIGLSGSTASTSQALSLGPVTYASLWDKTIDGATQSEGLSTNYIGSSPEVIQSGGMLSVPELSQKEPNDPAVTKSKQNLPSVSEETLIHVTDVSDLTDNQYSSLASKINSIVCGEDMSLNISWKTNDEFEAFELSKTSTRSSVFDKEVSHIDSPQLVTILKDESPFFLLSDGDCDMSHRFSGDTGEVHRAVSESPHSNCYRQSLFPNPTSSVQNYVIHDPVESKLSEPQTYRINIDSVTADAGVEQNAVISDHGRRCFLRKIKRSVRSLSNGRKKTLIPQS